MMSTSPRRFEHVHFSGLRTVTMGCNNTPSFFILVYVYVVYVVYVACVLKSVTCGDVMQTRVARVQSILY